MQFEVLHPNPSAVSFVHRGDSLSLCPLLSPADVIKPNECLGFSAQKEARGKPLLRPTATKPFPRPRPRRFVYACSTVRTLEEALTVEVACCRLGVRQGHLSPIDEQAAIDEKKKKMPSLITFSLKINIACDEFILSALGLAKISCALPVEQVALITARCLAS